MDPIVLQSVIMKVREPMVGEFTSDRRILHTVALDHERLRYRHAGRDFRLTDIAGNVATDILA